MTRKLMVLGLTAILSIAVAVPVPAQDRAVAPKVSQGLSKRAMAMARTALQTSRAAKRQSRRAERKARAAANSSRNARGVATATQAALDSARTQAAVAAGTATTDSTSFVSLPGGPSLKVTVPSSGLIEVWAQATMDEAGAVSLFEDGQMVPGQAEFCGVEEGQGVLFSSAGAPEGGFTIGTPAVFSIAGCGTFGAPGPVLFQTTPGEHTYELRYAYCGCEGEGEEEVEQVTFSNRRLFAGPRL